MKTKRKVSSPHKLLKAKCDRLWSEVIKIRAGYESELNGNIDNIQSHHILGKNTYSLRYALENGICLTLQQHLFGVHNHNPKIASEYFKLIINKLEEREGDDILLKLELIEKTKVDDLKLMYIFLKQEKQRLSK
jgi:hypothetical protein